MSLKTTRAGSETIASVAELADALDLGSSARKGVQVRFLSLAFHGDRRICSETAAHVARRLLTENRSTAAYRIPALASFSNSRHEI